MSEHSKLPWRVNGCSIWCDDGYVAELSCPRGPDVRDADAALIVHSVNLLPELVKALEEIAKQATSAEMQASVDADCAASEYAAQWHATAELADFRGGYDECIARARAALSKARAGASQS